MKVYPCINWARGRRRNLNVRFNFFQHLSSFAVLSFFILPLKMDEGKKGPFPTKSLQRSGRREGRFTLPECPGTLASNRLQLRGTVPTPMSGTAPKVSTLRYSSGPALVAGRDQTSPGCDQQEQKRALSSQGSSRFFIDPKKASSQIREGRSYIRL